MRENRVLRRSGSAGVLLSCALMLGFPGLTAERTEAAPMVLAGSDIVNLVPHRAIYEMTLDTSRQGSGVTNIDGRMVFELTGSDCEGYTQNMRFVINVMDDEGSGTITDVRSSSWEKADGNRFRFNSSQYNNQQLQEVTTGDASRVSNSRTSVNVRLRKPSEVELKLPGEVLFPIQHSRALIKAAREGRSVLQAAYYDGAEKGQKVYATTAIIGKAKLPGIETDVGEAVTKHLHGHVSWPIAISYFDDDSGDAEAMPVYELSFRIYDNGVSRKLLIDYGDFSIRGKLSSIEFFDVSGCKLPHN